jgi:multidrug efflux pump subunit AcrA (membrane-fusion protein)
MEAEGGAVKRRKRRIIIIAVIAAAAVLSWFFIISPRVFPSAQTGTGSWSLDATALEKTDLEKTVTATGTFESVKSRTVSAAVSADVEEVYVSVGDKVTEGQVLCKLDTSDIDESIADAEEAVADAEAEDSLALSQAQRKLSEAKEDRSDNNAAATKKIKSAKKALAKAKTSLTTAKDALKKAKKSGDSKAIETAQSAVEKATSEKTQAQEAYDQAVESRTNTWKQDTSAITQAQDSLATQRLHDSAEQARAELGQYEDQWDECTIKAPIDGIVTAVNAVEGESSGGSSGSDATSATGSTSSTGGSGLFTIQDLSALEVSVTVAEYDATQLSAGLGAHITSDTFDDKTWEGTVKTVSPVATDTSGNFTVVVALDGDPDGLTVGMSAKVEIVVESVQDVYAVPIDAVVTKGDGSTVVYAIEGARGFSRGGRASGGAIEGGQGMPGGMTDGAFTPPGDGETPQGDEEFTPPGDGEAPSDWGSSDTSGQSSGEDTDTTARTEIPVTTGMETDYYIEISGSGLSDGLMILNDPLGVNAQSTDSESGFGGGMGMGMGGGIPGGGREIRVMGG